LGPECRKRAVKGASRRGEGNVNERPAGKENGSAQLAVERALADAQARGHRLLVAAELLEKGGVVRRYATLPEISGCPFVRLCPFVLVAGIAFEVYKHLYTQTLMWRAS
jgi:hypothetical protein